MLGLRRYISISKYRPSRYSPAHPMSHNLNYIYMMKVRGSDPTVIRLPAAQVTLAVF